MTSTTPTPEPLTGRKIMDTAPLGALIRFSDGTPRPPARFKNKLSAWETKNGTGRLVEKTKDNDLVPARIKLHMGDFVTKGVTIMTSYKTFMADGPDSFFIEALPQPGSVRILDKNPHFTELVHLAEDQAAAETWIARNADNRYTLEVVA